MAPDFVSNDGNIIIFFLIEKSDVILLSIYASSRLAELSFPIIMNIYIILKW